jgi:hypothetical protein
MLAGAGFGLALGSVDVLAPETARRADQNTKMIAFQGKANGVSIFQCMREYGQVIDSTWPTEIPTSWKLGHRGITGSNSATGELFSGAVIAKGRGLGFPGGIALSARKSVSVYGHLCMRERKKHSTIRSAWLLQRN